MLYICCYKTFNFKIMWKLKNNDEYAVIASTKKQAIMKFKRDLGMDVKGYMLIRV